MPYACGLLLDVAAIKSLHLADESSNSGHMSQQTEKDIGEPELFRYCFAKPLNYDIETDFKFKNIYNFNEKDIFIDLNKRPHAIVRKSWKNSRLLQYNLKELETVMEFICADKTKLPTFVIFCSLCHCTGNLIQT